jgi:hypothetical protein
MVQGRHPNQKNSGLWLPKTNDDFDKQTLLNSRPFFIEDLERSKEDLNKALDFANHNLTVSKKSSVDLIAIRREAIKVSQANLNKIDNLIRNAK